MHPWQWFVGLGVAAVVAYNLLPDGSAAQALTEIGLHASTIPAILYGIRRNRPAGPIGWYIVAGSQAVYAVANVLGAWSAFGDGPERSYPAPADVVYLAAYAGLVVGLAVLLLRRSRGQGAGLLMDTLTVSVGLSSLAWVFLVEPAVSTPGTNVAETVVTSGYALFDIAVVAVLIHLSLSPGARRPAFWLLGAAMAAQLLGDATYAVVSMAGGFALGHPAFSLWMGFYAFLGACALHPTMRELTEPDESSSGVRVRTRMTALAVAALVPPGAILFQEASRSVRGLAWITIVTFATVLARLFRTSRDLEQQEAVEQFRLQFVSVVSHELRTPLTVIKGALDSLQRGVGGELPSRARPLVALAISNGERLHRLVDDLLDVQRHAAGAGAGATVMDVVDLDDLFARVDDDLRARAASSGLTLITMPIGAAVRGDAHRLHQVLVNLVDNAMKFTPPGGTVRLSGERRPSDVLIRVHDDGRGIPSTMHERIFDPFQQVDASDARERNGTGLGLAICRSIVEQHGGRIWVESTPGHGATFLVTVPLAGDLALIATPDAVSAR